MLLAAGLFLLILLRPADRIGGAGIYVIDGDSLRIEGREVRLAGIDAVELRQFCPSPDGGQWSCGLEARQALERLTAGGVECRSRGSDRYGRALAHCAAGETGDIAAALVDAGWAIDGEGRHAAAEARAKTARRGIWRGAFQRPVDWRAANPRDGD